MKELVIETTEDSFAEFIRITRVEVIDAEGRGYTNHNAKDVAVSIQDEGRTLKVFLR